MVTPDELEASRKRFLWKAVHQLDILHSELASLYRQVSPDQKRIDALWRTIEEFEMNLKLDGVDYESYTQGNREGR